MFRKDLPQIALCYPENFPNELITDDISEISKILNVKVKKIEIEPWMSFEWIISTTFIAYIFKPYFEGFLNKVGEDHHEILKKNLKKLSDKGKLYKSKLISSSKSIHKLNASYDQSTTISLIIQTKNNRQIKLLFNNDLEKEDWDNAIDQILDYAIKNYEDYPSDNLTKIVNNINVNPNKIIYGIIDPLTKHIIFYDDHGLLEKYKK